MSRNTNHNTNNSLPNSDTASTSSASNSSPISSRSSGTKRGVNGTNGSHKAWYRNGYGIRLPHPDHSPFTTHESNLIRQAILNYCDKHNVSHDQLCSEVDVRSDALRGAWVSIAQTFTNRTVQSVYRHGLRIMHPYKRGSWEESEVTLLQLLVKKHGKKWSMIQNELHRSSESCRDKYREIGMGNFSKGAWDDEESDKLEKCIREVAKLGDNVTMKDIAKRIKDNQCAVSWMDVSEKMKTRPRLSCYKRFLFLSGTRQKQKNKSKNTANTSRTTAVSNDDATVVLSNVKKAATTTTPATTRKRGSSSSTATASSATAKLTSRVSTLAPGSSSIPKKKAARKKDNNDIIHDDNDVQPKKKKKRSKVVHDKSSLSSSSTKFRSTASTSSALPPTISMSTPNPIRTETSNKEQSSSSSASSSSSSTDNMKSQAKITSDMMYLEADEEQAEIAARTIEAVFKL